jgi:signal transduction histidine kinase
MVDDLLSIDNPFAPLSISAQELLQNVQAGVMVLDRDLRLLYANQWLSERTGLPLDRIIQGNLSDLLTGDDRTKASRALDSLFFAGQTTSWEGSLRTNAPESVDVQFTAQPIYQGSTVIAAQVSCLDVTLQHRALSEASRYRQELERQRQETLALYSIGVSCTLTMDLDDVLRLIYIHVGSLFTFTTFAMLLYDAETGMVSSDLVIRDGQSMPREKWPLEEDDGVIGYVIRYARPLLVYNWPQQVVQLPISEDRFVEADTLSWLSVPLVGKEQTLGVICLQHHEVDAFSEADQRSLHGIADQATMVIENARLHRQTERQLQELQQANHEMQALQDLSRVLQSSLNLRNVYSSIVNGVATWLEYDLVILAVVDQRTHTLGVEAIAAGRNQARVEASLAQLRWQVPETSPDQAQSLVIRAAHEARITATESLYELLTPEITSETADEIQRTLRISSLITAPLLSRDRLVGNLIVGMSRQEISDHEIVLLSAFASQSAIAIENAQLYEAQRGRVAQLEAIRDFGQHIASFLNPEELFTNTVELLRGRFGYARVSLWLKDENLDLLELKAQSPDSAELASGVVSLDAEQGSLVSWAATHRASRVVDNAHRPKAGPELAIPLLLGDRTLGVLVVQEQEGSVFDESDLFVLESLSNQVAVSIENSQLYDTVNTQLAEVRTLYMLSEQISSSLDTSVVLDSVTEILKRVLNCRGCVIFLLDEQKEWLEIQVSSGIKPHWHSTARLPLGEGVVGKVAQTGEVIYIPDAHKDPDFVYFDPVLRSILAVPLVYKGEIIGALNVDDDKPDAFSEEMERFLSFAAAQAAVAIVHARLYEALKERADRLARAHRELQESDRLRSEFVQNMSHELRTPLTFVKGYVELFLSGTLGELTEMQRDRMQIVADRTERVIQLVNEILALQQVERGDLNLSTLSLAEIAHSEVRSARAVAQQEGLTLIEDYEPGLRLVIGDRERLDRVFANLIQNAIKFTPDGSAITVRLSNEGDFVRADVIDQGIGIAEDHLDKIFQRFYQVDGSSKRRFGGTGLGLAIVKEIIDAHGGEITVASEVGVGSTFSFTVPVASEEPAA